MLGRTEQVCLWAGMQSCAVCTYAMVNNPAASRLCLWVVPAQLAELQGLVIWLHVGVRKEHPT